MQTVISRAAANSRVIQTLLRVLWLFVASAYGFSGACANPPVKLESYGFVAQGYVDAVPLLYLVPEEARLLVLRLKLHTINSAQLAELVTLSEKNSDNLPLWLAAVQGDDTFRNHETARLLPSVVHGDTEEFKRATLQLYDFKLHKMTDPKWYVNKLKRATDATIPPTQVFYKLWRKTKDITIGLMLLDANDLNGSAKGFDPDQLLRGVAPRSVLSVFESARENGWQGDIPSWRDCSDERMRSLYAALVSISERSLTCWQKCELVNGSWTPTGPEIYNQQKLRENKYLKRWFDSIETTRTIKIAANDTRRYGFTRKKNHG